MLLRPPWHVGIAVMPAFYLGAGLERPMTSTATILASATTYNSSAARRTGSCTPVGTNPAVGLFFLLMLVFRDRAAFLTTSTPPFGRIDTVESPVVVCGQFAPTNAVRYDRPL